MMDSVREKIIQRLAVMASGISVSNGYQTDLGQNAKRACRSFDEKDLPATAIWGGDETSERRSSTKTNEMLVGFEGHHAEVDGMTNDAVINLMIADICQAIETHDVVLYALIDGIGYNGAEPEYPEDGGKVCSVRVNFIVTYTTVRGDPYSQP